MKKTVYLLFLFLILSLSKSSFAQEESELYLLELKGGLSVKCYLVSITDNTIYAISLDGKKLTVEISDVKSFVKIDPYSGNKQTGITEEDKKEYPDFQKDFTKTSLKYNKLTTTLKFGPTLYSSDRSEISFSFSGIINYELGHFSGGAGFILELNKSPYFPIFADIKYNFNQDMLGIPFVFVDVGYSLASNEGKGFMYIVGAGIKRKFSDNINMIFDIDLKTQKYNGDYYLIHSPHENIVHNLVLSAGIQF